MQPLMAGSLRLSRGRRAGLAVGAAAFLVSAALPVAGQQDGPVSAADAVVAFVDTGINPYHVTFRDGSPRSYQHPSTYLEGYPTDARALPVTLDAPSYKAAVKTDCELWKSVQPGTLYWVPGTKIVGAISFSTPGAVQCTTAQPSGMLLLDLNGHGTMVASRGTSTEYGACPDCLTTAVQFPASVPLLNPGSSTPPAIAAVEWAAANAGWIDAQSNSWGPIVPLWEPTGTAGLLTANPDLVRAVEKVSSTHLAAWASGNGAAFRGGVLGHPTLLAPHLAPSAVIVGGHDSGRMNTWPGFPPHVVSDSCSSWAARRDSTDASGDSVGSGTSAATPFVAGGAARILMEARELLGDRRTGVRDGVVARGPAGLVGSGPLVDGLFTLAEWKRLVLLTATARPVAQYEDGPVCPVGPYAPTPVRWVDVPPAYPEYVHIGYGAVDTPAVQRAVDVLNGSAAAPDRARTDDYFALDAAARHQLHKVFAAD